MTNSNPDFEYYRYDPSMAAAIIFIILFIATTSLHFYQLLRTRTWYFIPFVIGGFFEWIGYIGRAVSSQQSPNWTLGPYLIQTLLLLVAPALFAASIYMELGRIILLLDGEQHALIKRRWLTKLFVTGDVCSFLLQAGGGGISAGKSKNSYHTGNTIVVGGLFVQALFFAFFLFTSIRFDVAINKFPTPRATSPSIPWKKHLNVLYTASTLIMVRSIFRIVEFIMGNNGYILKHEVFLYLFDGLLMASVMAVFNVVHPSEVQALLKGGKSMRGVKMVRPAAGARWQADEVAAEPV